MSDELPWILADKPQLVALAQMLVQRIADQDVHTNGYSDDPEPPAEVPC